MVDAGIVRALANSMLSMDEPDHKRLRDIVDEAFRRRAVLDMEPHIQAIARRTRRRIVRGGQSGRPDRALCAQAAAVGDLRAARPAARRPAEIHRPGPAASPASPARSAFSPASRTSLAMKRYHRSASRNRSPARRRGADRRDRAGREGGRKISRDEMVAMVFLLLFAGHETTTHLISGACTSC